MKALSDNKDYYEKEGVNQISDLVEYFWKKERSLLPKSKSAIYYSYKLTFIKIIVSSLNFTNIKLEPNDIIQ